MIGPEIALAVAEQLSFLITGGNGIEAVAVIFLQTAAGTDPEKAFCVFHNASYCILEQSFCSGNSLYGQGKGKALG